MPLAELRFFGESIAKSTAACVFLPRGTGPFPVLYLLHGLSDDYSIWQRRTSLERYLEGVGLIVVMPDGGRSLYVDDPRPGGRAYEQHITQDLVKLIDSTFHTVPGRRGRAIAGLSMGGYGAMMLAMRHPELYAAACSHSGALHIGKGPMKRPDVPQWTDVRALAAALPPGKYGLNRLARSFALRRARPALRLDCGTEDGLIEANRSFHALLDRLGINHEYAEHPGAHEWGYWDAHIRETIDFVVRHVRA